MQRQRVSGFALAASLWIYSAGVACAPAWDGLLPAVEGCITEASASTANEPTRISIPGTDITFTLGWYQTAFASSAGVPVDSHAEHVLVVDEIESGAGKASLAHWTHPPEDALAALEVRDADTGRRICLERPAISGVLTLVDALFMMGHGAAHPQTQQRTRHWQLDEMRPLVAVDIFQGDTWTASLASIANETLATMLGDLYEPVALPELSAWVADPARWRFSAEGLVIHFDAYEVAPYFAGAQHVHIPWSRLSSLLAFDPRTGL